MDDFSFSNDLDNIIFSDIPSKNYLVIEFHYKNSFQLIQNLILLLNQI